MQVEQISVFLENRAGRLSEVTAILTEAAVNVYALVLDDTSDFGVLRMIVNNTEKARQVLKHNGFTVGIAEVVAVEVTDQPGGLHDVLVMLHESDLNGEYMYAFACASGDRAVMIFRIEKAPEAIRLLESKGVSVIEGRRLHSY